MERGSVIDAEQTRLEFSTGTGTVEREINGEPTYFTFYDWLHTAECHRMNKKISRALMEISRPKNRLFFHTSHPVED